MNEQSRSKTLIRAFDNAIEGKFIGKPARDAFYDIEVELRNLEAENESLKAQVEALEKKIASMQVASATKIFAICPDCAGLYRKESYAECPYCSGLQD